MQRDDLVFSIVIPTWNRPDELAACVGAIATLDYPHARFELIVVDDGSTIPLEQVVARFRDTLDVTLLAQPHAGPAAARNTGVARARGRIIAFTDDDCLPEPGWLGALAARFDTVPSRAVGGRTMNGLPTNPYAVASQIIVDVGYAYFNPDPEKAEFFATTNLALPADRLREIGGFDPTLTTYEDRDLCDRWLSQGWTMAYAPEAIVLHRHTLTLRALWRQHYHYGRGALHFHAARARRNPRRVAVHRVRPDPRFYWRLARHVVGQPNYSRAVLLGLVALAQGATAAGFLRELLRQRRR